MLLLFDGMTHTVVAYTYIHVFRELDFLKSNNTDECQNPGPSFIDELCYT